MQAEKKGVLVIVVWVEAGMASGPRLVAVSWIHGETLAVLATAGLLLEVESVLVAAAVSVEKGVAVAKEAVVVGAL